LVSYAYRSKKEGKEENNHPTGKERKKRESLGRSRKRSLPLLISFLLLSEKSVAPKKEETEEPTLIPPTFTVEIKEKEPGGSEALRKGGRRKEVLSRCISYVSLRGTKKK